MVTGFSPGSYCKACGNEWELSPQATIKNSEFSLDKPNVRPFYLIFHNVHVAEEDVDRIHFSNSFGGGPHRVRTLPMPDWV